MASSEELLFRLRQVRALLEKASKLVLEGNLLKALDCCDRAIKQHSNHFFAWYTKADILSKLERYPEALEAYNQALTIEPDNADARYRQAGVLHQLGQHGEAIALYDHLLADETYQYHALFQKSKVLGFIRQYSAALAICEQLLTKDENDVKVLVQKANLLCDQANTQRDEAGVWSKQGNREAALSIYNRVLGRETEHFSAVLMFKSLVLDDLGRHQEAAQAREAAHLHVMSSINHEK